MPFDSSFENVRLIKGYLTIVHQGKTLTLDLNGCLSAVNGSFKWGGNGGFKAAKNPSLINGSMLSAELPYGKGQWQKAQIELNTNIEIKDGQLVFRDPASSSPRTPPSTPPPSYEEAQYFRAFKETKKETTYSKRSSSYLEFSVGNTLSLKGSVLHAKGRKSGDKDRSVDLTLDLDTYVGVLDGRLVWGRKGFFSVSKNTRVEGFVLHADCEKLESETGVKTIEHSTLDLSRYLQIYAGKLGVKVADTGEEMSDLFSEARWLKFKVVTELDSTEAIKALEEKAAFKAAFGALAETTSEYLAAETKEFSASAAEYVKQGMTDQVKEQATTIVSKALAEKVENEINKKIKETFTTARETIKKACDDAEEAVLKTCSDMVGAAAGDVAVEFVESVIGPMRDQIVEACDTYTRETLEEVSASALAHFQERAEIMMEREIIGASIRRAQTKARILQMFMQDGVI